MFVPERVIWPVPVFVMPAEAPPSLMIAGMVKSGAAVPLPIANVRVTPPSASLPLMEAVVTEASDVRSPPKVSVPVPVVTLPPPRVRAEIVSLELFKSHKLNRFTVTFATLASSLGASERTVAAVTPSPTIKSCGIAAAAAPFLNNSNKPPVTVVMPA